MCLGSHLQLATELESKKHRTPDCKACAFHHQPSYEKNVNILSPYLLKYFKTSNQFLYK